MSQTDRPNVLFIAMDDMNQWLGCLGVNPDVRTPNIDRLAAQGTLFSNACCPSPVCNPSRTAFLTGMRPTTTGCYFLRDNLEHSPQRAKGRTFPLHFRHQGYRTLTAGKIDHGGGMPIETATKKTFGESMWDEDAGFFDGQQFTLTSPYRECMRDVPGIHNFASHWGPLDDEVVETLSDVRVARWGAQQLQRDFDQPFLLAVGFFRPHVPLIAPHRFFDMYDPEKLWLPPTGPDDMEGMPAAARQVALAAYQDYGSGTHKQVLARGKWREIMHAYLAAVSFVDDCIGQVVSALENSPYADNTIVVLASDNGWHLGEHFHWKKWSVFDGGARVPLIVKAPGIGPAGQVCNAGVDHCDIYPTLVDLCGVADPGHLEGLSLRPLLADANAPRERPGLTSFGPNSHSLRTARYRYTRYCDGSEELYDYDHDPWEHSNLSADPALAEVKAQLARWLPTDCAPAVASTPPPGGPLEAQPGQVIWFCGIEDGFAGRRVTVSAKVKADGDGVIVHHGGFFAGYSLYVRDGRLCMAVAEVPTPLRWDRLDQTQTVVKAETPLGDGEVEVRGVWDTDGTITLSVNGEQVATGRASGALPIYPAGVFECGQWDHQKYPNIGDSGPSKEFAGTLKDVRVTFTG